MKNTNLINQKGSLLYPSSPKPQKKNPPTPVLFISSTNPKPLHLLGLILLAYMGSNGRIPPPHMRRPLPGPGMMHPGQFGPSIRPPSGPYPPFDRLPPPEVLEQKLAVQQGEIQRLASDNQRLAATHVALRQELAAAQQELQRLQAQVGAMKHDKEQQMRGLMDKIAKMEGDLKAADPIKLELQQAQAEAHKLIAERQELITNVQRLSQDFQKALSEVQQIPVLMSELEGIRQEYHHCRTTYDYEKKLYNEHYESLQVMEQNYLSMAREVEKLRAELANATNMERRSGAPYGDQSAVTPYGSTTGFKVNEAAGHQLVGHNAYEDGYSVSQGHGVIPTATSPYSGGGTAGSASGRPSYDATRGQGYDVARGPGYDGHRVPGYDAARGTGYEPKVLGYDAQPRNAGGPQRQVTPGNSLPYGSAPPPNLAVGGHDAKFRGGNPAAHSLAGGGYEAQLRGGNPATFSNPAGSGYEAQLRGENYVRR